MKSFPKELDLLSLFSVKPGEPVPLFYYDESTYPILLIGAFVLYRIGKLTPGLAFKIKNRPPCCNGNKVV
ncbi:MAG: hypothetical protein WBV68_10100 [Exiguobacterium oxidotolerans]